MNKFHYSSFVKLFISAEDTVGYLNKIFFHLKLQIIIIKNTIENFEFQMFQENNISVNIKFIKEKLNKQITKYFIQ